MAWRADEFTWNGCGGAGEPRVALVAISRKLLDVKKLYARAIVNRASNIVVGSLN